MGAVVAWKLYNLLKRLLLETLSHAFDDSVTERPGGFAYETGSRDDNDA
jgi:hypothetical protein